MQEKKAFDKIQHLSYKKNALNKPGRNLPEHNEGPT
jgi:hypothetical protein